MQSTQFLPMTSRREFVFQQPWTHISTRNSPTRRLARHSHMRSPASLHRTCRSARVQINQPSSTTPQDDEQPEESADGEENTNR